MNSNNTPKTETEKYIEIRRKFLKKYIINAEAKIELNELFEKWIKSGDDN